MQLTSQEITAFQKKILEWYEKNQRSLPWRHNRDPYRILISEVMLQQTQVARVIEKYQLWMHSFPTIQELANASTRDVLSHWSGLGYNRRALFLHRLAKELVETYDGKFPESEKVLLSLPGIGKYTARALLCFAFDQQIAVVDTNIKKIILTQFPQAKDVSEREIEEIAGSLLPEGKAYEWNQALMDYASMELKNIAHPRVAKQKPFQQSDRLYRGEILRILLKNSSLSENDLYREVCKKKEVERTRFERILSGMVREDLLKRQGQMIAII